MRVTVSRVWDGGEVTAFCSDDIVGVDMELDSFLRVLFFEAEITDEETLKKLLNSVPVVLSKMKKETAKVVL